MGRKINRALKNPVKYANLVKKLNLVIEISC